MCFEIECHDKSWKNICHGQTKNQILSRNIDVLFNYQYFNKANKEIQGFFVIFIVHAIIGSINYAIIFPIVLLYYYFTKVLVDFNNFKMQQTIDLLKEISKTNRKVSVQFQEIKDAILRVSDQIPKLGNLL